MSAMMSTPAGLDAQLEEGGELMAALEYSLRSGV
jgi:hypothetical protein